ncbi:tyrosine-protein phosphatase [Paracoccus alkanivorans]|uniref:Protein-tyrosine-phosphatase n=1 Tax=Paracoccus alkanivorans TaxID=2116655 RepID=A0A3M0LYA0_9RHOB|nr:tyrosine-protein phosphatase [Paracoccus alkanivorans]RMC30191.1 protein-tyrosine-phosphatase [Paracoccus alkanivorans]
MTYTRHIPLQGSFNLRDLGGYRTAKGQTAWRRYWRADSLHRLGPDAMATLVTIGCSTVIDLRHDTEITARPNPFFTGQSSVSYHHVSLFEGLDPTQPGMADAENVLLALYCAALDKRGEQFAQVLRLMAEAPGGVLFHCTAGKDRTGMIAAFLLLLAGASRTDIVADYVLTGDYAPAMFAALRAEQEAKDPLKGFIDLSSPLLLSEAGTMEAFLEYLDQLYGGAEAYLLAQGLRAEEIVRLRARLLQPMLAEGAA